LKGYEDCVNQAAALAEAITIAERGIETSVVSKEVSQ
jgi:hypothetical protein